MNNQSMIDALQDVLDYTNHTANWGDPAMGSLKASVDKLQTYINQFSPE